MQKISLPKLHMRSCPSRTFGNKNKSTRLDHGIKPCTAKRFHSTVDPQEIAKFSEWAGQFWDPNGPLKPLHHINPTRVKWIKEDIIKNHRTNQLVFDDFLKPLKGLKILDVGCGAGLLCESLVRLGASVTGIDACKENVEAAILHSKRDPFVQNNVKYIHTTAENLAETNEKFDVVCTLEVIEHVSDVPHFVNNCAKLVKPQGRFFLSTLNRTPQAYALAIIGAEYVLKLVGTGTHDWNKFLTPTEVKTYLTKEGLQIDDMAGIFYNPVTQNGSITSNLDVNYIVSATKI